MKYQLMLKDILKYTERAGLTDEIDPLRAAFKIMVIVPKAANDMMDVGRLQGFEVRISKACTIYNKTEIVISHTLGRSVLSSMTVM